MPEQKGRLRLVSRMRDEDGQETTQKHAGYCTVEETAEGLTLHWQQHTADEKVSFYLLIAEGKVRMRRSGEADGELFFSPGQRTKGTYMTPCGAIDVETETRSMRLLREERGGALTLDYALVVGGAHTSDVAMELLWRL